MINTIKGIIDNHTLLEWCVMLGSALIIFIIGLLLINKSKKKKTGMTPEEPVADQSELEETALKNVAESGNTTLISKAFDLAKLDTISVFRSPRVSAGLYRTCLATLTEHLSRWNLELYMAEEDQKQLVTWISPVLVIYPKLGIFLYHNDQDEVRKNTHPYEMDTNDTHKLISEIDNRMALMRGTTNEQ